MANLELKIEVRMKWWLRYAYIPGLIAANWFLTTFVDDGYEPDMDKINAVLDRGLKYYVDGKRVKRRKV